MGSSLCTVAARGTVKAVGALDGSKPFLRVVWDARLNPTVRRCLPDVEGW
jgi:hypothetical protein